MKQEIELTIKLVFEADASISLKDLNTWAKKNVKVEIGNDQSENITLVNDLVFNIKEEKDIYDSE